MVAIQAGLIGPQADGTTPFQNPLDIERHMLWARTGQRPGIVKGLVPSVVAGQMQLSFSAGSAVVCERDGSQVEQDRMYPVYSPSTAVVQFSAASALNRNDAVVAAAVDVEDGAQGTGAIGVGGHIVVVPGVSGTTTPRTDAHIAAFLGRGGWHRLYDVPIASGSTQINLAGATKTAYMINDWNAIPSISAAANFSLVAGKTRYMFIRPNYVHVEIWATRSGSTITASSDGNHSDTDICTINSSILWPITDTTYSNIHIAGTTMGSARIGTSGVVALTDMYPTATLVSGNTLRFNIAYPVI
jgi:hypothetical protein